MDLRRIYLQTLARCAPESLVAGKLDPSMPRNVVAIGKCAGSLLDGVARVHRIESAFAAVPEGYPLPRFEAEVHIGGHPGMTAASFAAGRALLAFVDRHDDILFLVSGGGSACVEVPLAPFSEEEVAEANARLVASGLPIGEINRERGLRSAIKHGRLRERVRGACVTLVYSDVSSTALSDVASGPTIAHSSEAILIADNSTLTTTAAALIGPQAVPLGFEIEGSVDEAARLLAARAKTLEPGQILVAGGEPTVAVTGPGRGGRCSELAVRFAAQSRLEALFASSDGVDGNSGTAGFYLPGSHRPAEPTVLNAALAVSDSYRIATQVGEPIIITATGNNLRDLFLVSSNSGS